MTPPVQNVKLPGSSFMANWLLTTHRWQ